MLGKEGRRPRQGSVRKQDLTVASTSTVPDEVASLGLEHLQLEEPRGPTLSCHFHDGKTVDKVTLLAIQARIVLANY